MPLANPYTSPRSLGLIAEKVGKWTIVDVGARGGVSPVWDPMVPHAQFVCFDPDPAECERLEREGMRFVPAALDAVTGARTLHLTRSPWCHGFNVINRDAYRFPNWVNNEPMGSVTVPTTTLDLALQDVPPPHFVKIDTEGSELDVLRGGVNTLGRCLGVMVELWYGTKDAPWPWMVDRFLQALGFRFYDIAVQRYPRNTMPVGHLRDDGTAPVQFRDHGQVMTGDALYFRDPFVDLSYPWSVHSILHLIGLLDLWGYQDAALELAFEERDRLEQTIDVDALVASLVPPINGTIVSFEDYWRRSAAQFGESHLAEGVRPKLEMPR